MRLFIIIALLSFSFIAFGQSRRNLLWDIKTIKDSDIEKSEFKVHVDTLKNAIIKAFRTSRVKNIRLNDSLKIIKGKYAFAFWCKAGNSKYTYEVEIKLSARIVKVDSNYNKIEYSYVKDIGKLKCYSSFSPYQMFEYTRLKPLKNDVYDNLFCGPSINNIKLLEQIEKYNKKQKKEKKKIIKGIHYR